MSGDEAVGGGLQIDDRAEDAILQPSPSQDGKEALAEALGTAIALNAGAALAYTVRVFDTIEALPKEKPRHRGR